MSKIAVYAIAKNEEQFIQRWYDSVKEADYVCVLDTGSTDNTVNMLKSCGAIVESKIISPWRFDVARNESLKIIPEDANILVCVDLDEIIQPGWAEIIRNEFKGTRGKYRYIWSHNEDGSPGVEFYSDKIHVKGYEWVNPVHEVLKTNMDESYCFLNIRIDHYPDHTKSRSNYLPLLELAIQEDPENDRNMHYLGREYMFHGQYDKAIETLEKHINMPSAVWDAERAASMRFIARCKIMQGDKEAGELWYNRAIAEAPQYREGWYETCKIMYHAKRWKSCIFYGERCIEIMQKPLSYICEAEAWGPRVYDMLSMAYWHTGRILKAVEAAERALSYGEDKRIRENLKIMQNHVATRLN